MERWEFIRYNHTLHSVTQEFFQVCYFFVVFLFFFFSFLNSIVHSCWWISWHSCKSIYIQFKVLLTSTVDYWNHYCIYCCIRQIFSNIALIMHILLWWFYPKRSQMYCTLLFGKVIREWFIDGIGNVLWLQGHSGNVRLPVYRSITPCFLELKRPPSDFTSLHVCWLHLGCPENGKCTPKRKKAGRQMNTIML